MKISRYFKKEISVGSKVICRPSKDRMDIVYATWTKSMHRAINNREPLTVNTISGDIAYMKENRNYWPIEDLEVIG